MKAKLGIVLILLGLFLLGSAGSLFLANRQEEAQALDVQQDVLPQLVQAINTNVQQRNQAPADAPVPVPPAPESPREMTVQQIDGESYVGFLSIPDLTLELSVMSDWSYPQLQKSPCRYSGNLHADDLVISAHNYWTHFGQLKNLKPGSPILFTDMDGNQHRFEVAALEVLSPYAIEEMTNGEYDLTLFTCTYGGQNRVTVRCDRVLDHS